MEHPGHTFPAEMHFLRDLAVRVGQRYPLPGPLAADLHRSSEGKEPPYRLTLSPGEVKDAFESVTVTESMLAFPHEVVLRVYRLASREGDVG